MRSKLLINLTGWYGSIAILLAYALISLKQVEASSSVFQLLNLSGAAALAYISWNKKIYSLVVLNIIWMTVAAWALIKIWL